jgi:4-alpha-glucanotransferase
MNFPGKVGGYWRWRYRADALSEHLVYRLHEITELYGRAPGQQQVAKVETIVTEKA